MQPLYTMDIERRLALAVSRGPRQTMLINELLVGPVFVDDRSMGSHVGPWFQVGRSQLSWSSFTALKRRLVDVGFIFEGDRPVRHGAKITMVFPEGQKDNALSNR
jgi:hypothetical protein